MVRLNRFNVTDAAIEEAFAYLKGEMCKRIAQHGRGALVSDHEILGVMDEEHQELREAVHGNFHIQVRSELMDIAVGALFSWASSKIREEKSCS